MFKECGLSFRNRIRNGLITLNMVEQEWFIDNVHNSQLKLELQPWNFVRNFIQDDKRVKIDLISKLCNASVVRFIIHKLDHHRTCLEWISRQMYRKTQKKVKLLI